MRKLEYAIAAAAIWHAEQKDKAGEPYILHCLRVMMRSNRSETDMIVAVFHDIAEDTPVRLDGAVLGDLPEGVQEAIDAITRRGNESYGDYIERVGKNEIARRVKLADLADNLDRSRIKSPNQRDYDRWWKYENAVKRLTEIGNGSVDGE